MSKTIINMFCWACVKSFGNERDRKLDFVIQHSYENRGGAYLELKCTSQTKKQEKVIDEDEEEDEEEQIEGVLRMAEQTNHELNFQPLISYLEESRNDREFFSIAEPYKWSYYRYSGTKLIRNVKTRNHASSNETLVVFCVGIGNSYNLESTCCRIYEDLSRLCKYVLFLYPGVQLSFNYVSQDSNVEEEEELFSDESRFIPKLNRKRPLEIKDGEKRKEISTYPHNLKIPKHSKNKSMKDEDEEERDQGNMLFLKENYNDKISNIFVINPHILLHMNEVSVTNRCRIISYSDKVGMLDSRRIGGFWSGVDRENVLKKSFYEPISLFKNVHNVTETRDEVLHSFDVSCEFELSSIKSVCVIIRFSETYVAQKNSIMPLSAILLNSLKKVNDSLVGEKKELEKREEIDRCVEWITSSLVDIVGMSTNSVFKERCVSMLGVADIRGMKNSLEVLVRGKIDNKEKKKKAKKKRMKKK